MITKQSIQYSPLLNLKVKCVIKNATYEGIVLYESQQLLEIQTLNTKKISEVKKILKSSLEKFEVFNRDKNQFIEVDTSLIRGDLTYRLKKMK